MTRKKKDSLNLATATWLGLRYVALVKANGACSTCKKTIREDGVTLHVEHIQSIALHPQLAFVSSNLRVVCSNCLPDEAHSYMVGQNNALQRSIRTFHEQDDAMRLHMKGLVDVASKAGEERDRFRTALEHIKAKLSLTDPMPAKAKKLHDELFAIAHYALNPKN